MDKDLRKINRNIAEATKQMGNATAWIATLTLVIIWVTTVDIVFYYMTAEGHKFDQADLDFIFTLGIGGLAVVIIISVAFFFFGHNIWEFLFKRKKRKR